ncbi:MAG: hypothetical protein AAFZ15_11925 [Bacteroidota bacterium]
MFAKLAPQSAYRPLRPLLRAALRSSDSDGCHVLQNCGGMGRIAGAFDFLKQLLVQQFLFTA